MMRMMSKWGKGLVIWSACFCLLLSGTAWASRGTGDGQAAENQRVYDMAGLFPEEEEAGFESRIAEYRKSMKMDLVVVTTEDASGKSARDYADDYYEQGDFGYGSHKTGILYLIDLDNGEVYLSTEGAAIRLFTDQRIETMLDHIYEYASQKDYGKSVDRFLDDVHEFYEKGIVSGQYNYDTETGRISVHRSIRWYEALFAVAVAAVTAGTACAGVISRYGMKKEHRRAANYLMAYRADCRFVFANQGDQLVNKFVSSRVIPRNTSSGGGSGGSRGGSSAGRSSTHRSSSGRSHGGGGRKL